MKIGVNGTICDEREAVVSIYDHGFLYGIGLFETFRTYNGFPFLLKEHLDRLRESCEALDIQYAPDSECIERQVRELLTVNDLSDGYIRLTVSAGKGPLGLPNEPYSHPNVVIYVKELPILSEDLYVHGKPLQLLKIRRNSPEGNVRFKSFHYMNNILAKKELQQYAWSSGAEGLFLNEKGQAAEGIVSNVFFVRSGRCFTPAVETGILPGITRGFVIGLALQIELEVHEGYFSWEDLMGADELFITNSIQEIVPICVCCDTEGGSRSIGAGRAGPVTELLMELYRKAAWQE